MFSYLDSLKNNEKISADVCIVGAGPAGITMARELIGSGLDVVMLESGNLDLEKDTQNLYAGDIVDNIPPEPLDVSRLRYFGGTSNHWGGVCSPLSSVDLKQRSWIPHSGWPLSRKDLDPYYARAQEIIGLGPFDYKPSTWDAGYDVLDLSGTSLSHIVLQLHPQRFGRVYRDQLRHADNIRVIFHANLTRIRTSDSTETVTSLDVQSLSGKAATVTARSIVLACSGVGNARLLLASGFEALLPAAGRYFMFHPKMRTSKILLTEPIRISRNLYRWKDINDARVMFKFGLSEEAMMRAKVPNHLIGTYPEKTDASGYGSARRLYTRPTPELGSGGVMDDLHNVVSDMERVGSQSKRAEDSFTLLSVVFVLDLVPHPDSRVMLDDEKDALGMRRPKIEWRYHDFEPAAAKRFLEVVASSFGASGAGRLRINDKLDDETVFRNRIREFSGSGHQMGTTRMSTDRATGVVDANCKVHGVGNLYCAGSSVFPTGGSVNPTFTIVALAARLADHLKKIRSS